MAKGGVSLETGVYEWDTGQYQGRELPPGWFSAPHEEGRMPADTPMPPPRMPAPPPVEREAEEVAPSDNSVRETVLMSTLRPPTVAVPMERVDLVAGKARFMGHDIDISNDGIESIKMILAMEIDVALERERARIFAAVHQPDLQVPASAGGTNVPAVQGSSGTMDKEAASGDGAV